MKDALTALVIGMACILFGIIFFLANYSEERLSCSSAKRSCELTKTYLISPDAITFIDLNKITKIEYRKIRENKGSTGFSVLWGEKGEERKILRSDPSSSLENFNKFNLFFTGKLIDFYWEKKKDILGLSAGVCLIFFGIFLFFKNINKPLKFHFEIHVVKYFLQKNKTIFFLIITIIAIGYFILFILQKNSAHLVIYCQNRCEIEGATCMPESTLELWTDPGLKHVKIYAPKLPSQWYETSFTARKEETTKFSCRLP